MPDQTLNLALPYILPSQSQKHVTHNEALRLLDTLVQLAVLDRDLTAPPGAPAEGQRWIVKTGATGAWTGHVNAIAAWQDGVWQFSAPQTGWLAYVVDEGALLAWTGSAWIDAITALTSLNNMTLIGLGTTADAVNPFSAKLNNALMVAKTVAEGGDGNLRYKLSKESAAKTLSWLLQDNFSGRAEIGLTGDDDLHVKVSPDGSSWFEALTIDRASGAVSFPLSGGGANLLMNGGMTVSQERAASSTTLTASGSVQSAYVVDQWMMVYRGSFVAAAQQVTDAPGGYENSLKLTVSTAQSSLGGNDELTVVQPVEGYRVSKLALGKASAGALAIAFWVKAHRAGTYSGAIKNTTIGGGSPRSFPFAFTVDASDTWEFKAIRISQLDTGSTWGSGAAAALYLAITIAAGASRVGTANAWAGSDVSGATGTTNGVAATTDTFQITGVVALPGIELPPAKRAVLLMRPTPQEEQECQRHFHRWASINCTCSYSSASPATGYFVPFILVPPMRTTPAGSINVGGTTTIFRRDGATGYTFTDLSLGFADNQNWTNCVGTGLSAQPTKNDMHYITNVAANARL